MCKNWTGHSENGGGAPFNDDTEYVMKRGGLICGPRDSGLLVPPTSLREVMSKRTGMI